MPIAMAPMGPTNPEAGVIVAKPATAPVLTPSTLGLPWRYHSTNIHVRAAEAAANWVTIIAMAAVEFAATALPALNPNQPTHNIAVPVTVMVRLWGGIATVGYPDRFPSIRAQTARRDPRSVEVHDNPPQSRAR